MSEEKKTVSLEDVLKREPQFTNEGPLDLFFKDLNTQIVSKIRDDSSSSLYADVGCESNADFALLCCKKLSELNSLALAVGNPKRDGQILLPISLHDMKFFDLLVNLVVVHGIYANLPAGIGIPLQQRRLNNFREQDKRFTIPCGAIPHLDVLQQICYILYDILTSAPINENAVSGMLLKGTGFTDLYTGLVVLYHEEQSNQDSLRSMLENLESLQGTYELLSIYSLLVHTTDNIKYKDFILSKLTTLPIRREDGVLSVIDFVVGIREDEEINVEKLCRVNQILVAKPKDIKSSEYFSKLFDQIYGGLVHVDRPILISCLNNLIIEFYRKNKRIVQDFLFRRIYRILYNESLEEFSSKQLNDTINVIISLSKITSVEVAREFTMGGNHDFYLTLWVYAMYLKKNQRLRPDTPSADHGSDPYYKIIIGLIKAFITLTSNFQALGTIVQHLVNFDHGNWGYGIDFETQLPYIKIMDNTSIDQELNVTMPSAQKKLEKVQEVFLDIDLAIDSFTKLLKMLNEPDVIKNLFLSVMNRWVRATSKKENGDQKLGDNVESSLLVLVDLKLLEKMNESFKEDIISKPRDVLILVNDLLDFCRDDEKVSEVDSDDESEDDSDDGANDEADNNQENFLVQADSSNTFITLLKLLSAIISTTNPKELVSSRDILESIANTLSKHSEDSYCQSLTARIKKIQTSGNLENNTTIEDVQTADRYTLKKAMANLNDPSVPVRAYGLYELRSLIDRKSPVIELEFVLNLHAKQLHEQDPFIYLNAIKGFVSLCQSEPTKTMDFLLDFYTDRESKRHLDDLLKVGEVLLNYVTDEGEMLIGKYANLLIETCLEKVRHTDTVDNRLRMSAMSIMGMCLRVNSRGIRERIPDILDCSFGILRLENASDLPKTTTEQDVKLVRRSAVHLIYDLIYSAGLAALPSQYSGPNLTNLLNYVKQNDQDYLTCEQVDALQTLIRNDLKEQTNSSEIANGMVNSLKL